MNPSSKIDFIFTKKHDKKILPFSHEDISTATYLTNDYLKKLPNFFGTTIYEFYSTLNQRNLSGFIGEVFKYALHTVNWLRKNFAILAKDGCTLVLTISTFV